MSVPENSSYEDSAHEDFAPDTSLPEQVKTQSHNRELIEAMVKLTEKIDRQNEILTDFIKGQSSFRTRIIAGIWTGLGTVLGATVVVSLLVIMLKPLTKLDWIAPVVGRVIDELQTKKPLGNQSSQP